MAALPNKKEPCAAILIAGSCATSYTDVVARKSIDKSNPKGNLMGSKIDVGNMYGLFLRSKVIKVVKTFDSIDEDEKQSTSKADVLNAINNMFQDTERKTFILYYSGHGRSPSIEHNRKGGDWVFEGVDENGNKSAEFLSLHEIISLWNNRKKPMIEDNEEHPPEPVAEEKTNAGMMFVVDNFVSAVKSTFGPQNMDEQRLIIIADCCFSGGMYMVIFILHTTY